MTWQHTGVTGVSSSGSGGITSSIQFGDSPSIDAFARARISSPFTLFDSKQVWNDPDIADSAENFPLFWDNQETSGGGTTTTFNANRASTTLAVANTTAGTRVRQTRQRFNYQPGKSLLVILTGLAGNTSSGNTKRYGYYDDSNGVFYQDVGGSWSVVIRSFVSGAAVDTAIAQADWNIDPLDGTGPSGVVLDPSKVQILFFDLEWLGVGRVRFGFFVDGVPLYCHEALHSNRTSSVYMSTANLPVRGEISNDGTGSADSVELICSTVISEGGSQANGIFRGPDPQTVTTTVIQANLANISYAVAAIRLKSAYLSAKVVPASISALITTNDNFMWSVHYNPTLSSALTFVDIPNSAIQYAFGDTGSPGFSLTDRGTVIAGGLVSTTADVINQNVDTAISLGSLINGTSDTFVLAVTPVTAGLDARGAITWRESW